jgi:molybdate transport system substrate-binding protein
MLDFCPMGRRLITAAIFSAWLLGSPDVAAGQDLTIAAASDLQAVFPKLAEQFERETSHHVNVTFGSSGNFYAQIQNGAPFDLFFSADIDYPRQLERAGLAEPGTMYQYATGQLVLWIRTGSPVQLQQGLMGLDAAGVRRIAIANPAHAPYGRAAVAALRHEGLYDKLREKLVLGENVAQAAQFVQSGNAEAGILALALALTPALRGSGAYVEIPPSFYPPIEQAAIILRSAPHKDIARQFLVFLTRPEVLRLLEQAGFTVPRPVPHAG